MENRRLFPALLPVSLAVAILFAFFLVGVTLADNGPHGGFSVTTDACAGCHRAHTASTARLLVEDVPALCLNCHGNTGAGADTNVVDGVYLERDILPESPPEGVANQGLKGGGFQDALMDTDVNTSTTAIIAPATSSHLVDGSTGTAWGNGAINASPDPGATDFSLSCVSCHDPHGSGTYRILRPFPADSGAGAPIAIPDEANKMYTVADSANDYIGENYGPRSSSLASWCSQCHTRYLAPSGSGHTDSGDAIFSYRHTTTSISCVRCHVAHGTSAIMGPYSGGVLWPDGTAAPGGDGRSSLLRLDNRGVCAYCHLQEDGTIGGGACDACHGAPPPTGSHASHTGAGAVGYGLTGSFATDSQYQYGCGECHPLDDSQHQDGEVDVDLSPTGAPAASPKSQNEAVASFSGGSCSGVYCHSGIRVASGPVGDPLTDAGGNAILDEHGNLTYDPYTVTETRVFQTTPAWDGGQITTCTACHEFPLTMSYPSVEAGVGNSHQWIDNYGYGDLHAFNMSFEPLSCRTCHYGEITEANTWVRSGMDVTTYDPVPIASRIVHANGARDVAFDTVNDATYATSGGDVKYELDGAGYDRAQKACTNVGCHILQTYVEWGRPYRYWYGGECDQCHRISGIFSTALSTSARPLAQSDIHSTLDALNRPCVGCHAEPHGRR